MKREIENQLLDFCIAQKERFEPSAWMDCHLPDEIKATAALFLANTSWFGHRRHLQDVAERLYPGSVGRFSEMARLTDFDPSRFRGRLQARLAHEQGVS